MQTRMRLREKAPMRSLLAAPQLLPRHHLQVRIQQAPTTSLRVLLYGRPRSGERTSQTTAPCLRLPVQALRSKSALVPACLLLLQLRLSKPPQPAALPLPSASLSSRRERLRQAQSQPRLHLSQLHRQPHLLHAARRRPHLARRLTSST